MLAHVTVCTRFLRLNVQESHYVPRERCTESIEARSAGGPGRLTLGGTGNPMVPRRWLLALLLVLCLPTLTSGRRKKAGTKPKEAAAGLPPVVQQGGASENELYSAGTTQLNQNRLQEALASFDAAVAASPRGGRTNTRVNRGLTLQRLGRLEDALASYNGALQLDPRFLYALYNKGLALRKMGRQPEAVEALQAAVAVKPTYADAHHDLCASLFEGRDPAGDIAATQTDHHRASLEVAMASCDAAVANDPDLSMAHETKGLILDVLGRRAEADYATATALNLSPTHRALATVAKKLQRRGAEAPSGAEAVLHKLWPTEGGGGGGGGSAPQSQVSLLSARFPYTPFYLVQSTSSTTLQMNAGLQQVVRAMKAKDPSGGLVSNIGGWQSRKAVNFLEEGATHAGAGGAAVKALHLHIMQQVGGFLRALGLPDGSSSANAAAGEAPFVTIREAWANVNRKGHWNHEHSHGTTVFAGCYYIDSGFEPGGGSGSEGGNGAAAAATGLRLHSPPPPGGGDVEHWSTDGLGKAGTLALWPGTVVHSVPEHTGDGERISIAFNVGLTVQDAQKAIKSTETMPSEAECGSMLSELIPTCGLAFGVQPSPKDYPGMCALSACVTALNDFADDCPAHGAVSIVTRALSSC